MGNFRTLIFILIILLIPANSIAYQIKTYGTCIENKNHIEAYIEKYTRYNNPSFKRMILGYVILYNQNIPIVGYIQENNTIIANGRGYNFRLETPF